MRSLILVLSIGSLLMACADKRDTTPTTTSVDNSNASTFAKLGMQQFIALHNSEILVRQSIVGVPNYTSPCSSGSYTANFNDVGSIGSLDTGDSIVETYSNCVLNTGNVRITGTVSSKVSALSNSLYTIEAQHSGINLTNLTANQSYQYNGPVRSKITADNNLLSTENFYTNYTLSFNNTTTVINSGTATVRLKSNDNSYSIKHSIVFTTSGATGQFRTDTTSEVTGAIANNQGLFSGDPNIDETSLDANIAAEKAKGTAAGDAEAKRLENTRKAFRPFVGRLRVESIINNQFVEITSEDSDNDTSTYQRNVRANRVTTPTTGLKWADLLS